MVWAGRSQKGIRLRPNCLIKYVCFYKFFSPSIWTTSRYFSPNSLGNRPILHRGKQNPGLTDHRVVAANCSSTLQAVKLCKCLPRTLHCDIIPRTLPLTNFFTSSQKNWSKLQKNPLRAKKKNKISSQLRTCPSHSLLDPGLQSSQKHYYTLAFLLTLFHSHQFLATDRDKTKG